MFLTVSQAVAQGRLEDYQRAQRFLPGNLRSLVSTSDITPNWIEKTNRFWYRKVGPTRTEFILVDAERNTSSPAFDHSQLASALSHAAHRAYDAAELPFDTFEFVDQGKAIRLKADDALWTCILANYECKPTPADNPYETPSPNKQWAAYVKDHNLYLRSVSTGQTQPLTQDGEAGWDYATPLPSLRLLVDQQSENPKQPAAVFWSADSSKLVSYRIDSRNSGHFTSLQFAPRTNSVPERSLTYILFPAKYSPRRNRSFSMSSREHGSR